jgi:hypothetical protein
MTQDEIIEMARQSGWTDDLLEVSFVSPMLERFAKLVAAKAFQNGYEKGIAAFNEAVSLEREACAKVCDSFQARDVGMQPAECAGAIRARGEQALAKEKTLQALHSENERLGLYKDAYAQPEQEPSGHFLDFAYSDSIAYVHVYDQFRKGQQFYKAPPQRTWVGLTDEEVDDIANSILTDDPVLWWRKLSQAIEAKLKQKNGFAEEKNT